MYATIQTEVVGGEWVWQDMVQRGVMVRLVPAELLQRQKNFLSLVSPDGDTLHFVVNVFPFKICEMDVHSGECRVLDLQKSHPEIHQGD